MLCPPFLSGDCVIDLPGGTIINHPMEFHPNNRLQAGARSEWPLTEEKDGTPVGLSKVPHESIRAYEQS